MRAKTHTEKTSFQTNTRKPEVLILTYNLTHIYNMGKFKNKSAIGIIRGGEYTRKSQALRDLF